MQGWCEKELQGKEVESRGGRVVEGQSERQEKRVGGGW